MRKAQRNQDYFLSRRSWRIRYRDGTDAEQLLHLVKEPGEAPRRRALPSSRCQASVASRISTPSPLYLSISVSSLKSLQSFLPDVG